MTSSENVSHIREATLEKDGDAVGGYKWMVLAASFFSLLITASISYNVGVLNVAVHVRFPEADVDTIAWLMALYSSLFSLGAPIASAIINASNCRFCVFLSGITIFIGFLASSFVTDIKLLFPTLIIAGLGQSLSQVGSMVVLVYYFPTRTAMATGIAISGAGAGSFMHPALLQVLIEKYSLNGAFLVLSAVSLNGCVMALLMRPTRKEFDRHTEKQQTQNNMEGSGWRNYVEVMTEIDFIKVLIAILVFAIAFQSTVVYWPEYLVMYKGFARLEAASVASMIGIGTLLSRPLVGIAASDKDIGEILLFVGLNFVSFLFCITANGIVSSLIGAYIVSLAFGLYTSSTNALTFPMVIHVLGYKRGASGYGIIMMVFGIGSLVGPPFYAFTLQSFGYWAMFPLSGALFLFTAAVSISVFKERPAVPEEDGTVELDMTTYNESLNLLGSQNFTLIISSDDKIKRNDHINHADDEEDVVIDNLL